MALYLLIWCKASNLRLIPECLCFIFNLADEYYTGTLCEQTGPFRKMIFSAMSSHAFGDSCQYGVVNGGIIESVLHTDWIKEEKQVKGQGQWGQGRSIMWKHRKTGCRGSGSKDPGWSRSGSGQVWRKVNLPTYHCYHM